MPSPKSTAAAPAKKVTAVRAETEAPIAFASSYLATYGHGVVVVARRNGVKSDTSTFIVDAHCLGARRATRASVPTTTFMGKVLGALHAEHHTVPVPPEVALGIIVGAVSFAKSAGFPPAAGYEEALALFGDLEAAPPGLKFGKAGKPHFHPMPGDDEEFCEEVLGKLRRSVGPNGFTYDLDELDEDHLDGDDDAETGEGFGGESDE